MPAQVVCMYSWGQTMETALRDLFDELDGSMDKLAVLIGDGHFSSPVDEEKGAGLDDSGLADQIPKAVYGDGTPTHDDDMVTVSILTKPLLL